MKCEKCNKNEANFYYKCTVNGKTEEKNLCSDCAKEEGLMQAFDYRPASVFDELFVHPFGLMDSFFGGSSLFSGFGRSLMAPVLSIPRIQVVLTQPESAAADGQMQTESAAETVTDEAVAGKRELNALKYQLQEAVKEENFEKAIELRDKIKELEK